MVGIDGLPRGCGLLGPGSYAFRRMLDFGHPSPGRTVVASAALESAFTPTGYYVVALLPLNVWWSVVATLTVCAEVDVDFGTEDEEAVDVVEGEVSG